jgi:hypothetical protein
MTNFPKLFDPQEERRPATGVAPWDTYLVDSLNDEIGHLETLTMPCHQSAFYEFDPRYNPLLYANMRRSLLPVVVDATPAPAFFCVTFI